MYISHWWFVGPADRSRFVAEISSELFVTIEFVDFVKSNQKNHIHPSKENQINNVITRYNKKNKKMCRRMQHWPNSGRNLLPNIYEVSPKTSIYSAFSVRLLYASAVSVVLHNWQSPYVFWKYFDEFDENIFIKIMNV